MKTIFPKWVSSFCYIYKFLQHAPVKLSQPSHNKDTRKAYTDCLDHPANTSAILALHKNKWRLDKFHLHAENKSEDIWGRSENLTLCSLEGRTSHLRQPAYSIAFAHTAKNKLCAPYLLHSQPNTSQAHLPSTISLLLHIKPGAHNPWQMFIVTLPRWHNPHSPCKYRHGGRRGRTDTLSHMKHTAKVFRYICSFRRQRMNYEQKREPRFPR